MLLGRPSTNQDIHRLASISAILIRYGFSDVIQRLGGGTILESVGEMLRSQDVADSDPMNTPQRLRKALEEMGPTFVKLGQILSTRSDLFPPAYITELEKLRDKAKTISYAALVEEVEADFGHPLADMFGAIEEKPLAAGSIAQVHRAQLKTGESVVLKIRRPGVRKVIEADLRLLMYAAELASRESEEMRRYRPVEIVTEFSKSIRSELDLVNECRNAERIANSFRTDPSIRVPTVYWQWTSQLMNVQEFVAGIAGSDLVAVRSAGLDLKRLAAAGANAVMKMILEDRFYHADPHPGNVFYLPGEQIVFIDFGMVGHLSRQRRDELVDLLFGFVERRADRVVEILCSWAETEGSAEPGLAVEIDAFIDRVHGATLGAINLSSLAFDLVALMRKHKLALPPDLTLLIKAFVSLEGMGRELDPQFNMVVVAQPFLERIILRRYSVREMLRRSKVGMTEGFDLITQMPGNLKKLIDATERGKLKFGVEIEKMDHIMDRFEKSVTRVTIGIVIAALTLGSSIVMTVSGEEIPVQLSVFAMMGFFGAIIGGFWLLYSIWRGD